MEREKVRAYDNTYCKLQDVRIAAYGFYARKHALTAKELFVLDILWFAPDGCLQSDICDRLSATKQRRQRHHKKVSETRLCDDGRIANRSPE